MATTTQRARRTSGARGLLQRIEALPEWGIDPVPHSERRLGGLDVGVLWGNLGISLLLPVVGAFLVPALSFRAALLAILVGALIGNVMLAAAARIGAETGAPGMVTYRGPLGLRGSYLPTVFNVLQNVGWGAFELSIMAAAAAGISARVLGPGLRPLWIAVFGALCVLMAVGGPVTVVRAWIRRYAVWLVLGSSAYLTVYMLTAYDIGAFWRAPGQGGFPSFWQGVDLVVALPISWIPLVADYTRFARTGRSAFWGAGAGYFIANVWFFVIGVLLLLGRPGTNPLDPAGFVGALLAIPAGGLAMLILLVDETDEAFANIYSASVSVQNVVPRLSQRWLSVGIGAVCAVLALVVNLVQYENFLLLLGALFVPLFGVLAADYFVLRRGRYSPERLYGRATAGVRGGAVAAWAGGFLVYNWLNAGTVTWWTSWMRALFHDWLGVPFACDPATGACGAPYTWPGASLASFVAAFALTLVLPAATRRLRARTPVSERIA